MKPYPAPPNSAGDARRGVSTIKIPGSMLVIADHAPSGGYRGSHDRCARAQRVGVGGCGDRTIVAHKHNARGLHRHVRACGGGE